MSPNVAVDRLDLEIKKGSVTFLLVPNGGGKTTTLKCVAGMTAMDKGSSLETNVAGTVFGICPQANVCFVFLPATSQPAISPLNFLRDSYHVILPSIRQ